ncbi:MAG: 2-hydroxychromene-2-carboxylate isomerase [Pseudomonadota bacterium]
MKVIWYLDFISPYPYLQLPRFDDFPAEISVEPRPVLFAALLNHWGHKGPAEIPAKRRQTALYTAWLAKERGLPFLGPPRHPFNPLSLLRLAIAVGPSLEVCRTILAHVWGEGHDGQTDESLDGLAAKLGVSDWRARVGDEAVKAQLKSNTEEAIARGVFGVPTLEVNGELFWGDDATPMMLDYLRDPDGVVSGGMVALLDAAPGAVRPRS